MARFPDFFSMITLAIPILIVSKTGMLEQRTVFRHSLPFAILLLLVLVIAFKHIIYISKL